MNWALCFSSERKKTEDYPPPLGTLAYTVVILALGYLFFR